MFFYTRHRNVWLVLQRKDFGHEAVVHGKFPSRIDALEEIKLLEAAKTASKHTELTGAGYERVTRG